MSKGKKLLRDESRFLEALRSAMQERMEGHKELEDIFRDDPTTRDLVGYGPAIDLPANDHYRARLIFAQIMDLTNSLRGMRGMAGLPAIAVYNAVKKIVFPELADEATATRASCLTPRTPPT